MTHARHAAILELLRQRTEENTRTTEQARKWILRDRVHKADGELRSRYVTRPRDLADA